MKAYKGFNESLECRDFQYEIGGEYEEKSAELCSRGFHACESPLDVFNYYPPAKSRFCEVEIEDNGQRHSDDSKVVGKRIKIGAEIGIAGLAKAHIEYVKQHVQESVEKGDSEAATAGECGAATAGDGGAATAGDRGAATSRGASATGVNGLSVARGNDVKVKGGLGAVLVIAEECEDSYEIKEWLAAVVDGETIKPDVWYCLKNGEFTECE